MLETKCSYFIESSKTAVADLKLFSSSELSEKSKLARQRIHQLVDEGFLIPEIVNIRRDGIEDSWYFSREQVEAFLHARKINPPIIGQSWQPSCPWTPPESST